jgi:hypothetical protein
MASPPRPAACSFSCCLQAQQAIGGRLDQQNGYRIMKASLLRKADRVAKDRAPKPEMRFLWWDLNEPYAAVEARIRAMIASGEASETDRFVTCTWTRPEGEGTGG